MLEIDILKRKYRQFRQWQKQPAQYDHSRNETHHCNNCGQEFTGSHCFACGQKHTVGRISWLTVRQGVMDIWGIGTRSLPYTLLQLIFRPGYLIHDYISGKRQVCFPPVKMLFIVTICCLFIVKWFFPHVLGINYQHVYDESEEYFSTFSYLMTHQKAWGILYALSAMIIPTWVIFRYAPKYKRHSLPEGFYIQIFIGTVLPFFPIFYRLLPSIINYLFYLYL